MSLLGKHPHRMLGTLEGDLVPPADAARRALGWLRPGSDPVGLGVCLSPRQEAEAQGGALAVSQTAWGWIQASTLTAPFHGLPSFCPATRGPRPLATSSPPSISGRLLPSRRDYK